MFTTIALGTLATIGLNEGARGVILPRFLADLALQPAVGAAILSAVSLGWFLASLSFGGLVQRFGLKRVSAAGALLTALSFTLFLAQRSPALLFGAMAGAGAGLSMLELSTSLPISLLYKEKQGSMLNLLHGLFGVGALLGPLWVALWLGLGLTWRVPLGLIAVLMGLWFSWFIAQPRLELPAESAGQGGLTALLRDPLVWAAALALGAAVAVEAGLGLWLPSYLQLEKGVSESASAIYATAFYTGFTATRLGVSWLSGRLGLIRTVSGLAALGAAGLALLMALPASFAWLSVLPGIGVAAVFPTCTALVSERHANRVNQVYSVMYSSGSIAALAVAPLMGWVGQRAGLTAAMALPLAGFAAVIACLLYWNRGPTAVTDPKNAPA